MPRCCNNDVIKFCSLVAFFDNFVEIFFLNPSRTRRKKSSLNVNYRFSSQSLALFYGQIIFCFVFFRTWTISSFPALAATSRGVSLLESLLCKSELVHIRRYKGHSIVGEVGIHVV